MSAACLAGVAKQLTEDPLFSARKKPKARTLDNLGEDLEQTPVVGWQVADYKSPCEHMQGFAGKRQVLFNNIPCWFRARRLAADCTTLQIWQEKIIFSQSVDHLPFAAFS
jgi:hypothetical protein